MPHQAHALLQVHVEVSDDATVLRAVGEIDLLTAPILAEAVDEALAAGAERLVIDCLGVTYLGSTGIGVLVNAWRQTDGRMSVRVGDDLKSNVRRVLELCGLPELLPELLVARQTSDEPTDATPDAGQPAPEAAGHP